MNAAVILDLISSLYGQLNTVIVEKQGLEVRVRELEQKLAAAQAEQGGAAGSLKKKA